jgi:hypothetical protein
VFIICLDGKGLTLTLTFTARLIDYYGTHSFTIPRA